MTAIKLPCEVTSNCAEIKTSNHHGALPPVSDEAAYFPNQASPDITNY
jgi:hypothetical protein